MSLVTDYFLQYVKIHTASSEDARRFPSTDGQLALARLLAQQLEALPGVSVDFDETYGYVYAKLPSNLRGKANGENPDDSHSEPDLSHGGIGLIAHMDTSPDAPGEHVSPRIVHAYDGGDIILNDARHIVMRQSDFPELADYIGHDLIVTDGTTLLGADDKAGVAEIMTLMSTLASHPEISHGNISVAFTPDEEIGCGTDYFDVKRFGASFAYTVDGGALGELEYENFNAASAVLTVRGRNVHPGDAKNKMRNALLLAYEFHALLPAAENPAYTEGYEGFYHPHHIEGDVEKAVLQYLIRDHDRRRFEERKERLQKNAAFLNEKYGEAVFTVEITDSYYNMKEQIEPHMHLIEHAVGAMKELGITPHIRPIRGGTDGARLSYMGLPCPNLGTGGHNFHSRYEYVSIQSMEKTVELLLKIVGSYA
ncbi:MAG: peptidase T [Lachnospiraceae bacterium]|nr:peptidase T [Lachnospiraceae bacterium]